jgi:hypothetical protein
MRPTLSAVADRFAHRVAAHRPQVPPSVVADVRAKVTSLLDDWASLAHDYRAAGTAFGYALQLGVTKALLREMLDPELRHADHRERRFRAPRSLRDVEPAVLLRKLMPNGSEIRDDERWATSSARARCSPPSALAPWSTCPSARS